MAQPVRTESERRIRAAVRTALSAGVWLVMGVQLAALALVMYRVAPLGSLEVAVAQAPGTLLTVLVLFLAYTYVMSGTSRSFAVGRTTVSALESLNRGREVFSAFLWLFVKVLLLGLGCLYALVIVAQLIAVAAQSRTLATTILWIGPRIIFAIAPFALVYWLPLVFVRNDFRLTPTMRAALTILWQRWSRSGFLAFLVFFPVLILWLLPQGAPLAALLPVSLIGQLMAWTAYVYCVEAVTDPDPGRAVLH